MKKIYPVWLVLCLAAGSAKAEISAKERDALLQEMTRQAADIECLKKNTKCGGATVASIKNDVERVRPKVERSGDSGLKAKFAEIEKKLDGLDAKLDGIPGKTATEVVKQLSEKYGDTWEAAARAGGGNCVALADRLLAAAKYKDVPSVPDTLGKALMACIDQGKNVLSDTTLQRCGERGCTVNAPGVQLYIPSPDSSGAEERAKQETARAKIAADKEVEMRRIELQIEQYKLEQEQVKRGAMTGTLVSPLTPPPGATSSSSASTSTTKKGSNFHKWFWPSLAAVLVTGAVAAGLVCGLTDHCHDETNINVNRNALAYRF